MKEYRVRAVFKDNQTIYSNRSYKRMVVNDSTKAKELLKSAMEYYSGVPYNHYIDHIEIQSREVTEWISTGEKTGC